MTDLNFRHDGVVEQNFKKNKPVQNDIWCNKKPTLVTFFAEIAFSLLSKRYLIVTTLVF